MAGNTVCIVDIEGVDCAPGVQGDLAFGIEDPGLMLGYWKDGQASLSLRANRWHVSGDVGYRDAAGDLYFVGRDDDIISSSGYRIGPTEVENALSLHPSVAECAVVASPDELRGEVVKAVVVLRPGTRGDEALASELQDHVKRKIAPYKYPRKVEFVESLPRTVSGKISRRLLRDAEFRQSSESVFTGG
jgi:acyl-coenzyme A synthetase/AMP-(fatty) acid ligase